MGRRSQPTKAEDIMEALRLLRFLNPVYEPPSCLNSNCTLCTTTLTAAYYLPACCQSVLWRWPVRKRT